MHLGLIAAARITTKAIVEPAADRPDVTLAAVAARSLDRARTAAGEWGIPIAYGSYDELLADGRIDAVYVATPAAQHRAVTVSALEHGKHVLCEKPLGSNADDARAMVETAERTGLVLMEAFHWRYHPVVAQVRELLDSGRIGRLEHVEARFDLPDGRIARTDIRWDLALGGGALMDLGCYPVQWVRWAVGAEPTVVSAEAETPVAGVDGRLRAELRWGDGTTGEIHTAMIGSDDAIRLDLHGSQGRLTVINPLAPQNGASVIIDDPSGREELDVDRSTTYAHQLDAFVRAVRDGETPPTSGADSIANMEVIDACYRAAGLEPRPTAR